jgi:hypothetical protein
MKISRAEVAQSVSDHNETPAIGALRCDVSRRNDAKFSSRWVYSRRNLSGKEIVGLAVYYKLGLSGFNPRSIATQALEELRRSIEGLGVLESTKVLAYAGSDCGPDRSGAWNNPGEFLKTCAWGHLDDPAAPHQLISVDPLELMGFVAWIGSRVEPMTLGLARYPEEVRQGGRTLPTGLSGWHWHASCKTHYARLLGSERFLEAHRTVIAALDLAQEVGLTVTVRDESGYAEHRDASRLLAVAESALRYGRTGPEPARV